MVQNILGNPVTGDNLFGRDWEVDTLWRHLEAGAHPQLIAPRRVGKSSLMRELERAPRPGWVVIYLNLESDAAPGDAIAQMIAAVATHPTLQTHLEALSERIPFRSAIGSILSRVKSVGAGTIKVELQQAVGRDWHADAQTLAGRLAALPADMRLLLILDELPILVGRLFKAPQNKEETIRFLDTLRHLRQDPTLQRRAQFLIGGSVGLPTILRRHKATATANDLTSVPLAPWTRETAAAFLDAVGPSERFSLPPHIRDAMLDCLEELIPFHIQLFFDALRTQARGDGARLDSDMVTRAFKAVTKDPHLNHYAERLEQQLGPEDLAVVSGILARVGKTRGGTAIKTALGKTPPPQAPALLRLLEDEGYIAIDEGAGRIRFRSEVLRLYWKARQAVMTGDYA